MGYYIYARHEIDYCRGRCLGGSTAINFMAYNKPPAEDVDGESHLTAAAVVSNGSLPPLQTLRDLGTLDGIGRIIKNMWRAQRGAYVA